MLYARRLGAGSVIMKIRSAIVIAFILASILSAAASGLGQQEAPPQETLRNQIGNIIVTPGNGPNLALADFVARAAGLEAAAATFNQVLHDDLDFAAVTGIVGKSLNPKSLVPETVMPNFGFNSREAQSLALLVMSWKRASIPACLVFHDR